LGRFDDKTRHSHPKLGASWEGFVIEQVSASEPHEDTWFWATRQGAEIDLILRRSERLLRMECKLADAPRLTPSIRIALADLGLAAWAILHPGTRRYPLADQVEAVTLHTPNPTSTIRPRNVPF
jgi:predicted AAA+ superfamily ATPase